MSPALCVHVVSLLGLFAYAHPGSAADSEFETDRNRSDAAAHKAAMSRRPHMVFVLADDYGWANFGVHRRDAESSHQARAEVHTPVLDALADAGILLERHYAYKICAPSRSSLQSGRLAVHVNVGNTRETVFNASDPVSGAAGIPRNMTGLAQKLQQAGYRTHLVGKWDAGMATPEHTPLGKGYETWLGYFLHFNDYWRKTFNFVGDIDNCLNGFVDLFMHNATFRGGVRDGISNLPECLADPSVHEVCYEEYLLKERALAIVREHNTSAVAAPLFLMYATHLVHTPLEVPSRYLDKLDRLVSKAGGSRFDTTNRRLYAAMTLYLDEAVGELVAELKAKSMWKDTLLIFSADNGGPIYEDGSANNHPLRGGKYSDWEGGIRVNAFLSGGFIPSERRGTRHQGIVSIADWYGTLCELAGVDPRDRAAEEANDWLRERGLPLLQPVDSVAQWGFIMNRSSARSSLHLSENALLRWPYKLVTGQQMFSGWQGDLFPNCSTVRSLRNGYGPVTSKFELFDSSISVGGSAEAETRLSWMHDCSIGCLFNVDADPGEHVDLRWSSEHADVVWSMTAELEALNRNVFRPGRGEPSEAACEQFVDNGGYYGPWVDVGGWYSPLPPRTLGEHQLDLQLKQVLRFLNKAPVEKGLETAAQSLMPHFRPQWLDSLDACLLHGDARSEMLMI